MADEKTKILIAFYSRDGSVEAMAKGVAEGAKAEGAEVRMRRAKDLVGPDVMAKVPGWADRSARMEKEYGAPTQEDILWADGVIFGTPTRFGAVASELKAFIDSLGALWFQGKLNGKAGGVFSSTQSMHGGNETTIVTVYNSLAHLGFIIVPLGYENPIVYKAGSPYGPTTVTGPESKPPTPDRLEAAAHLGKRVTRVASALKQAGITPK